MTSNSTQNTLCFFSNERRYHLISSAVIGSLIIVENIMGVAVIVRSPFLHTRNTSPFVISLAVTDLTVGVGIVVFCVKALTLHRPTLTATVDVTVTFAMTLLSIIHNVLVAVERYLYIARPYFYQRHISKRIIVLSLIAVWILCTIYTLAFVVYEILNDQKRCNIRDLPLLMSIFIALPVYGMCLVIAFAAYLKILIISLKQRRSVEAFSIAAITRFNPGQKSVQKSHKFMTSVTFFAIVFGTHLVMTLPGVTCCMLANYLNISEGLLYYTVCAANLNSGANFIILAIISCDFRQALRNAVTCYYR